MVIAALSLAAAAYSSKELFSYNRENFKFDRKQNLQRSELALKMQIARFNLFRDDIRDLTKLTVDRMDIYHLIGALFLHFTIVLFTKGRIQASAPPFLLALFMLTNACTFIYLLMAVWMSMHASIASHSFGVRLLTRFVRLPIPTVRQINALTYKLADFEKQGVSNLLRVPFANQNQEWRTDHDSPDSSPGGSKSGTRTRRSASKPKAGEAVRASASSSSVAATAVGKDEGEGSLSRPAYEPSPFDQPSEYGAGGALPSHLAGIDVDEEDEEDVFDQKEEEEVLRNAQANPTPLLPETADSPIGDEDALLTGAGTQLPERHIQLFRQLQSKWQCYDAYCRVCMGLGTNQMLQVLSYYSICHTLVENRSPTTGFALVAILQCTTVALGVLDLAGLKEREILVIQFIGVLPCLITAASVSMGQRNDKGVLDPDEVYLSAPLTFLFTVIWLELWLRVATPSKDKARLPRRFRQVLFLDVFGDAGPQYIDKPLLDGKDIYDMEVEAEEESRQRQYLLEAAAKEAATSLNAAVWALRRWMSVPAWSVSKAQYIRREELRRHLSNWGNTVKAELQRQPALATSRSAEVANALAFSDELHKLQDMTQQVQKTDPFRNWLVGPFNHEGVEETYHFSVEDDKPIFDDVLRKEMPDAMRLSIDAVASLIEELEKRARRLLEVRITTDLRSEMERMQSTPPPSPRTMAREALPNLVSLVQDPHAPGMEVPWVEHQQRDAQALPPSQPSGGTLESRRDTKESRRASKQSQVGSEPDLRAAASSPDALSSPPEFTRTTSFSKDPTAVAMAGENAEHFVPERLPWLLLSRMTRVLQGCWLWCCLTSLLSGSDYYKIDFAMIVEEEGGGIFSGEGITDLENIGGRRLKSQGGWQFDHVEVSWPHGVFFRAMQLVCPRSGSDELVVASPYGVFAGNLRESRPLQIRQLENRRHSASSSLLCAEQLPSCLAMSLQNGKVLTLRETSVWRGMRASSSSYHPSGFSRLPSADASADQQPGSEPRHGTGSQAESINVHIEGPSWRAVTGAVLPCGNLTALPTAFSRTLPSSSHQDGHTESCLLLVGWDGKAFPVAFAHLPSIKEPFGGLRSGLRVTPSLRIPWGAGGNSTVVVASLQLEQDSGRLWALITSGEVQGWDVLQSEHLGRWLPRWPRGLGGYQPMTICASSEEGFFALGVSETRGALLARAPMPFGARVKSPLEVILRRLSDWSAIASAESLQADVKGSGRQDVAG